MSYNKYATLSRLPFYTMVKKYVKPTSNILDIGAGDGSFAKFLDRDDITMMDSNIATVEKLKTKFPNYIQGQLPTIPFVSESFDIIHCSHILEHLETEVLYLSLKELDRCLKSNGIMVLSLPLLTDFFYDDLSHVKPYNPSVFIKYLTNIPQNNNTRPKISDKYTILELQYRYKKSKLISDELPFILSLFNKCLYLLGFKKYKKTGYTLILQKMQ
jgi:ubiquinone/menaquinone biosynthesis C-methylase UbiE